MPPVAHCNSTVAASRLITLSHGNAVAWRRHGLPPPQPVRRPATRPARGHDRRAGSAHARRLRDRAASQLRCRRPGSGRQPGIRRSTPCSNVSIGSPLAQFTNDYTILTRLGGIESTATVVQADNSRRSITINDVRFLDGVGTSTTCNLTTAECEAIINDARVSDLLLTHDFYGSSFARRLRVDAGRSLSPARGLHRDDRRTACDVRRRTGVRWVRRSTAPSTPVRSLATTATTSSSNWSARARPRTKPSSPPADGTVVGSWRSAVSSVPSRRGRRTSRRRSRGRRSLPGTADDATPRASATCTPPQRVPRRP